MRRHRWIYVIALVLIVVSACVIVGLATQKAPPNPFTFAGFTNTIDRSALISLGVTTSNLVELRYIYHLSVETIQKYPSFPIPNFLPNIRRSQGFGKGGNELFNRGDRNFALGGGSDVWDLVFSVPVPLPKEPWRLLLQVQGDLPGRTNRFKAFVRSVGQKCGFNMAKAEWLDTKVWVDIPGKP